MCAVIVAVVVAALRLEIICVACRSFPGYRTQRTGQTCNGGFARPTRPRWHEDADTVAWGDEDGDHTRILQGYL